MDAETDSSKAFLARRPYAWLGLLALSGAFLWGCWDAPFSALDDREQIEHNPSLQPEAPWHEIWTGWVAKDVNSFYIPLTNTTLRLDRVLYAPLLKHAAGPNAWAAGVRITSMLLQILAGVVLWWLLRRLGASALLAAFAAVAFTLHPLQCHAICWCVERKTILAAVFGFGALGVYVRARTAGGYTWSSLLYACALLSKAAALGLFPVVVAWEVLGRPCLPPDGIPQSDTESESLHRPAWGKVALRLLPWAMLSAAALKISLIFASGATLPPPGGTLFTAALTDVLVVWRYVVNLVCPLRLSFDYGIPVITGLADARLWPPALCLGLLVGLTLWLARPPARRFVCFAWLWFFGALGPALNFVGKNNLMSDVYVYFSAPAFWLILGLAAGGLCQGLSPARRRWAEVFGGAGVVALALVLAVASAERGRVYAGDETLMESSVKNEPDSSMNHLILAQFLRADALQLANEGRKTDSNVMANREMAELEAGIGGLNFERTLLTGYAYCALGRAYLERGRPDQAQPLLALALTAARDDQTAFEAFFYLGMIAEKRGDYAVALAMYTRAGELSDDPRGAQLKRAQMLKALEANKADGREVPVAGKFERAVTPAELGLSGNLNPYDPDEVKVDVELTFPDGAKRLHPCFWYVPCEQYWVEALADDKTDTKQWERFRPTGPGDWRLRFSPLAEGKYQYSFVVASGGRIWRKPGGTFTARPAAGGSASPIRVREQSRYFCHLDGKPFIPVGQNVGWPEESGATGYAVWLRSMARAGANAGRLWLVHYFGGTALEWSPSDNNAGYTGAGKFSYEAAERVDQIFAAAAENGIYLMPCFFSFGDQNWDWKYNPYAKEAGGWLTTPDEFFTDEKARRAVRNQLRYALARWGYCANLWAWELWNEVESSTGYAGDAVTAWHKEMAEYLKQNDVHHHLVTTSYRFTPPYTLCSAYALPELDFVQVHTYQPRPISSFPEDVRAVWKFDKPVLIGEYGLWVSPNYFDADPAGLHLHDGLWTGIFAGAAGGGMSWWWERYIAPRQLYFHYTGLARFLEGEDLDSALCVPCALTKSQDDYFAFALKTRAGVWGWAGTLRHAYSEGAGDTWRLSSYLAAQNGGRTEVVIEGDFTGPYEVVFYDTFDGVVIGKTDAAGTARGLTVPLPPFQHDVAFKCCPGRRKLAGPLGEKPATPIHEHFNGLLEAAQKN